MLGDEAGEDCTVTLHIRVLQSDGSASIADLFFAVLSYSSFTLKTLLVCYFESLAHRFADSAAHCSKFAQLLCKCLASRFVIFGNIACSGSRG